MNKMVTSQDLALGQTYEFTYEEVNGINVLDRIAPAPSGKPAQTASPSKLF